MIRGYRVWDNQEKIYSDKAFSINQLGICYVQNEDGYWEEIDDSRFIVEFETGLTDRNGNMIYESDILVFCLGAGGIQVKRFVSDRARAADAKNKHKKMIVIFDKPTAQFCYKNPNDKRSAYRFKPGTARSSLIVIGNIHENPELVGGEE